jgi:hypothetical protein
MHIRVGPRVSALQKRLRRAREDADDSSEDSEPSFESGGTATCRGPQAVPRNSPEADGRKARLAIGHSISGEVERQGVNGSHIVQVASAGGLTQGPTSEPSAMPRARRSDVHVHVGSAGLRMSLSHEPKGSLTPSPSPLLSNGPFAIDARGAQLMNGNPGQRTVSQIAVASHRAEKHQEQLASTALPNLTSQTGTETAFRYSAASNDLPLPNQMQSHTWHAGQQAPKPARALRPNGSDENEAQAWGDAWPSKLHGDSELRRTCSVA